MNCGRARRRSSTRDHGEVTHSLSVVGRHHGSGTRGAGAVPEPPDNLTRLGIQLDDPIVELV